MSSREGELTSGSEKIVKLEEKFNTFHLAAFIVCTVIGREYAGWQPALRQGFAQFMIAEIVVAAAFINYFFCLAEIWSAVPFSGGGYGLSRAMIGFCVGFLVGWAEVFVYVTHAANGALFLSDKICIIAKAQDVNAPLGVAVCVFAVALFLSNQPSVPVLRHSYMALAFVSVAVLLVWLLGSLKFTDFHENASLQKDPTYSAVSNWFDGGMSSFMTLFTFSSLPYAGVKSFALMVLFVKEPKVVIPRSVYIVFAVFALNMFVVFVNAAQPGGILHTSAMPSPMAVGFRYMFDTSVYDTFKITAFLSMPAQFAKTFAYLVPCGALFQSFGKTNLLPSFLRLNNNPNHKHGVVVTVILSYVMSVVIHFRPTLDLYSLCILFTVFSNVCVVYCYVMMKITCPSLERGFVNPLGIVGACFSGVVFLLLGISAGFFQATYEPLIAFAVLMVVWTAYYYGYAARRQTLCKEEDRVFMMLHVKNFNRNNKKHRKPSRGHRIGIWSSASSQNQSRGNNSNTDHNTSGGASLSHRNNKSTSLHIVPV